MATRRQQGEGSWYQRADGLWIGAVELGWSTTGKRLRRTVSSRDHGVALSRFNTLKAKVAASGGRMPGRMTVGSWLHEWLEDIAAPRLKPRTVATYRMVVRSHLAELAHRQLEDLEPQHVRHAERGLRDRGLAPNTIARAHWLLVEALDAALREGHVTRNVAKLVEAPHRPVIEGEALTGEEALALLTQLVAEGDPYGSRWAFALLMGARQGECLGLEWSRVDRGRAMVDLAWQLQRIPYRPGTTDLDVQPGFECRRLVGAMCLVRPKSRTGLRLLPMPSALQAWMTVQWELGTRTDRDSGLVWTSPAGRPVNPEADRREWHALLARLGLPPVKLHGARHTFASILLELGEDAEVIRTLMGHSNVLTTRGYQLVRSPLQAAALERLSQHIAPS